MLAVLYLGYYQYTLKVRHTTCLASGRKGEAGEGLAERERDRMESEVKLNVKCNSNVIYSATNNAT